jgi:predicted RNA binding protein YcfA (HicA-like mRNA interferase family)
MPKLTPTDWKTQLKIFQAYGCKYKRKKGSHHILTCPNAKRAVVIPEYMERRPVEDSEHKIAGEDKIGNLNCYVLESRPKEESDSQYSLLKSFIAKNIYIALSVEYYNKKGKLIKKYRTIKLEKIQNIWTETEVIMEDLKKKHKTILKINNIVYNTNIDDNIFTRQNLGNW